VAETTADESERLLAETRGAWDHQSLAQLDALLGEPRRADWGTWRGKPDGREPGGALYEPKLGRLPEIVSLRTAKNLETMRFDNFPHALEDLRREFKKVGFKEQERQISYAHQALRTA
jgi:hypothetical protein